ncbi:hypothetical protein D3C80_2052630 [compost metagenome]
MEDVTDLVDAMIRGLTSSAPVGGALDALEDGSIWSDLSDLHGEALQEAVEELHGFLRSSV